MEPVLELEKPQYAELPIGVYQVRRIPDPLYSELWESIILDEGLKESLICQATLNISIRSRVSRAVIPMHGIILLVGKPGTGKTSLAKGLASETAKLLPKSQPVTFLEVDPHGLASSVSGESQKSVTELFGQTIAGYAEAGPTIVLLDEVESILVDRAKLSLDANPIDVHRATDAALVELDRLAEKFPNLLILTTSNFPQAIDAAFVSRCDLVMHIPMPNYIACRQILEETLVGFSKTFPHVIELIDTDEFDTVVRACVGLDGRQIRKMVASACAFNRETAADPGLVTITDLLCAAGRAKDDAKK
jgi:AAA+ superfamily predicted ATPase